MLISWQRTTKISMKKCLDSCQKTLMIDFVLSEVSKNIYHISIPWMNTCGKPHWRTLILELQMYGMASSTLGKNSLSPFMSDISKKCGLSKNYTDHSIRVTGTSVLTRQNFTSEIMSITGHKSVQSLTRYQKTQDKEKIAMGHVMHQSMTRTEDEISVPERKALGNKPIPKAIEGNVTVNVASNAVALYTTPNSVVQKENVW